MPVHDGRKPQLQIEVYVLGAVRQRLQAHEPDTALFGGAETLRHESLRDAEPLSIGPDRERSEPAQRPAKD